MLVIAIIRPQRFSMSGAARWAPSRSALPITSMVFCQCFTLRSIAGRGVPSAALLTKTSRYPKACLASSNSRSTSSSSPTSARTAIARTPRPSSSFTVSSAAVR